MILYDGKEDIFGAQHSPMPTGLHVLMQTIFFIFFMGVCFSWSNILNFFFKDIEDKWEMEYEGMMDDVKK